MDKDIRVLAFQRDGDRTYLWAGFAAVGGAAGDGLMRIEARVDGIDAGGWKPFGKGWQGGSCKGIDFAEGTVVAGTNSMGVLTLDLGLAEAEQAWRAPPLTCGLPINAERKALSPITRVAAQAGRDGGVGILAGSAQGVFYSQDAQAYVPTGMTTYAEQVPLPAHWLYCVGTHAITVAREQQDPEP
ncbi:hypothetical protein [Dankookia sp. P2]|uniref:hypothetical protein n=1 Tax=Dankookia sp. P2 TaxID=3423955 RepID=UPI003D672EA2